MRLWPGTPPPHAHHTPLDAFGVSILAPSALANRRLGSPLLCSPNKSLNYTMRFTAKYNHLFSIENGISDICCFRGVILSPYNCS